MLGGEGKNRAEKMRRAGRTSSTIGRGEARVKSLCTVPVLGAGSDRLYFWAPGFGVHQI